MFLQLSKSVKQSAKMMVWGDMTGGGLTNLHVLPTGQSFTSEYYINQILAKEVKKSLTSWRRVTDGPIENIWCIIDEPETTYRDPAHKMMKELKRRLRFAGKNATPDTLKELANYFPPAAVRAIFKTFSCIIV